MNLIQVQDQLKSLPNDPRTMQALTAYANGANPAVPPYLALGELNRRKQIMEKAQMEQASQPPQGTVKDQVEQQAGIMALQAGRQQQAMQNAMQMGAAAPQGVPAGIPQPQAQGAVQAAGGGLMALLADRARTRRMNSGGIVALAGGDPVSEAQDRVNDENNDDDDADVKGKVDLSGVNLAEVFAGQKADRAMAEKLIKQLQSAKDPETFMQFRERMLKERPEEYGYLKEDAGKGVLSRLEEFQAAQRAEMAKRREEAAAQKPGILQLLGQAAMESRGQQGRSALASILGGYSKLQSGADTAAIEREQALRAEELKMQQGKMEVVNKLQELKRARDEGDIEKEHKAIVDIAKLAKDRGTTVANLVKSIMTSSGSMAGRLGAAAITAKAKENAARMTGNKPPKPTDQAIGTQTYYDEFKRLYPDLPESQLKSMALEKYRLLNPAGAGVVQRTSADADKALKSVQIGLTGAPDAWKNFVKEHGGDEALATEAWKRRYMEGSLPPALLPKAPQVKPTPVEPQAAKPSAPPSISSVKGAPAGASIGNLVEGKGWEIKGKDGKLLGYAK